VCPLVQPQVDALGGAGDPREQRLDELLGRPDEREDRAVVIRVRVDVEQPGMGPESVGERVDGRTVSPLREVRDGLERPHHARSLGT